MDRNFVSESENQSNCKFGNLEFKDSLLTVLHGSCLSVNMNFT